MTTEHHSPARRRAAPALYTGTAVLLALAIAGIWSRHEAEAAVIKSTEEASVPTVSVASAKPTPDQEDVVLPGTVQAKFDTPIYARTSGYIKHWYVDIGSKVKAGDLLADIDSPEVDRQLRQAEADLLTARANDRVAQATAKRVHALLPTESVSQQDEDQASSDAAAKAALVAASEANVDRLRQLVGFERVVAPYDGVVTTRKTDIGALIDAGSGNGPELFRVADLSKLRIYVQVPQNYAARIRPGVPVKLQFPEQPGRVFEAQLVRTANAIEPVSRTLLVELETDNAKGELFPGGYTDVHFTLPNTSHAVRVAANALLFQSEGLRVATAAPNGRVVLHAVTLGRDFGTEVEITTGLQPGDAVILNPPASLASGSSVRVRQTPAAGADRRLAAGDAAVTSKAGKS
ncbi:efflux RND transporter periplasmic adaptor subunit [Dyella humicola]|uniref:efflux RND transporter periplasmic adaptor subunit n=1 Tax=Dyella humicola TaxID=2992126 RepID=UPI00224FE29C|nr:efflux RND transporter periplasmic adaptor subunit [Dyella humicola]